MSWARKLLGLLALGGALWLVASLFVTPARPAEAQTFTTSRDCRQCHEAAYAEWEQSWHARSWIDEEVRKQSGNMSNKDCIDCHAPRPILETGLSNRVLPRSTRQVEGVDCISCHLQPSGRIAGTVDNPGAACRPEARRELIDPEFCAGCHDQHGTVKQWRASRFGQPGDGFQSCVDCHMPYRDGDPTKGRDHTMHGGHDLEIVRRAVELRGERDGDGWRVEVENVGAGHNYPTDERSRASDVFWRPVGETTWRHLWRFRNPYRHEVGELDTELPSGETKTLRIEDADLPAAGPVEVALFYKLSPYYADPERPDPDNEASLVHRLVLAP